MRIVDLFAGPGGWSEGLRMLDHSEIGVEWDESACVTARAAGHERVQADVAALDPRDFAPCWGLIASPPCQAFSMAGKGAARKALPAYADAVGRMAKRWTVDYELLDRACGDSRGHLVLEPLRWALVLEPTWIALEQVRPVLPLWEVMADALRANGYNTWTGLLDSERFGVPQTRTRAILMAHRERPVHPPQPTHQRFVSGEPARHEHTLDGEVLPWVSMAEALGWGMTARPGLTLAVGTKTGGASSDGTGGSGARTTLTRERERGAWLPAREGRRHE